MVGNFKTLEFQCANTCPKSIRKIRVQRLCALFQFIVDFKQIFQTGLMKTAIDMGQEIVNTDLWNLHCLFQHVSV